MTDAELKKTTLAAAARLIRKKEISPVELTQAVLDRVGRLNGRMRVYITVSADLALERARLAEQEIAIGTHPGPLLGVPISLKDVYDTKGIRTTAGSIVFAGRVPSEDATVVKRLNEGGLVLIGKTNMHEFAFGATGVNPHYGTPCNPWSLDRITGGSSSGSASSVALALAFGSLGSDTGGSIRIPAACCGIVGLKPTYGRVSLYGAIPLSWSLDHPGPMTQTVEDAALMLGLIAGYDARDPCSRKIGVPDYAASLTGNVKGIRLGIPRNYFFDRVVPEVHSAVLEAIRVLEKMGAHTVDVDLPSAPKQSVIFNEIACPEAYVYHEPYLETQRDKYGKDVRDRIEAGGLFLSVDYVRAQRERLVMKEECRTIFKSADVMVTPTLPILPPKIDQTSVSWGNETETVGAALTRFTRPFNITGLPAISVPCGFTSDGLPIGLQIAGKAFDESTVLRVADAYEREAKWTGHWPSM